MSPEILTPEFEVGTLNPNTFESGQFWSVNGFLSIPDIFLRPAICWVCGRTKMADLVMESNGGCNGLGSRRSSEIDGHWCLSFILDKWYSSGTRIIDANNVHDLHTLSEMTMTRSIENLRTIQDKNMANAW